MSLNFLYLKYFCDAVRLGGVTHAAKANFVTQSAISQGITKLEQSLGCSLLARHPNRFRLTPEGEQAFLELSALLNQALQFQKNFSQEHKNAIGNLEFVCTFSFALTLIPRYLKQFKMAHPDTEVNFHSSGNLDEIKQMLKNGSVDFGIIPNIGDFDFSGLEKRVLNEGYYRFYTSLKSKSGEEWILPKKNANIIKRAYVEKYEKMPQVLIEVRSWVVIANLTSEGLGLGCFPEYIGEWKKDEVRPCHEELKLPKYEICAIYPKGMKLRKSSEIFLSFLL